MEYVVGFIVGFIVALIVSAPFKPKPPTVYGPIVNPFHSGEPLANPDRQSR